TEDTLYSGNLAATDVDNSLLTYSIGTSPAKGVVTITDANTGAFTFVPASNATGSDSFTFKVNDGLVDSGYVTVNITINQVNDPPVGNPQSVTTNEDTTYTGTLSGSDVENSVLTFSLVNMPSKGVVILNDVQTGAFTYVPNVNANGSDSFTFKVNDGSADSLPVVVNLQILPVNDAPVLANFGVTGLEDTTISLNLADFTNAFSDPENDSLASIKILSLPSTGVLKLSGNNISLNQLILSNQIDNLAYEPVLNEYGTRQFTAAAYDGASFSEAATISLIVVPSNDIPTLSAINPLAGATEDTPFEITYSVLSAASNAADVEDSSLSFRVASVTNGILESWDGSQWVPASNTTVLAANQKLRWTPPANTNGILDAFTVVALDSGGLESATPVLVRVTTAAVNDVPVANAQSITPTEDTTYTGTLTGSDIE
ncbi:MAG: Ig-like domain-containing protein, partial [Gemmataceae bacterium]